MTFSLLDKAYNRDHLPNDVESLKDIIGELVSVIKHLQHLQEQNAQLQAQVEDLKGQVALLKQEKFGRKSEKGKGSSYSATLMQRLKEPKKKHPGRQALPKHLARTRVEYDLAEEEKRCPLCQGAMEKIHEVMTEQLDLVPAQLQVQQHMRFQYACRQCYGSIKRAAMPPQPIEKGLPTSRLLAQVMMSKFMDHLPFYRQERWFLRQGCAITRATMWGWQEKVAYQLEPIVRCLKDELLRRDHLFSDDTPMPMLEKGLGRTKTGRVWTYACPKTPTQGAITVYESTEDRKGKHPQIFLKDYQGYLQVDAYGGYDALFANNNEKIREVGCLGGHARRKFIEALKVDPNSIAKDAIEMIQELYKIEHQAREINAGYQYRKWLRKRKSKPILKKLYKWLRKNHPLVTPKSTLGKAIGYCLNHWRALGTFLKDGRLEIDNNRAERAIKPIVIGRKNYLFMGGPQGGWAAAIIYSLVETCLQNNVDPYHYLADVLERVGTHPNKKIKELLPYNWKPSEPLMQQAA